jgi:desulfoferrodoxin (superoxide reductase-like protein)
MDHLALQEYFKYAKDDIRLGQILVAWRNKDYLKWFELYHSEKDVSRHKMMSFGEPTMVFFTMKCIQTAYFQLPRLYVEKLFVMKVEELQKRFNCNWVLEDDTVVVRLRK